MATSQWQVIRNSDYRGGETQAEIPGEIASNQLIRMENALVYPSGWITAAHQLETEVITNATLGVALAKGADGTYTAYSAPDDDNIYSSLFETGASNYVDMSTLTGVPIAGARIVGAQKTVHFLGKEYCPNPNSTKVTDTRANSTHYDLGSFIKWSTGATVWKCTVAGTTASSAPSITGKVVGDTVVDGGVTWLLMTLTGTDYQPWNGILNLTDYELISIPNGTATAYKLRLYANRLWLIDSLGELWNCDNGDATTWNPMNIMLLANSEPVIDFHPVPGGAIVYSASAIYAMYGSTYTDITFVPLMQSGVNEKNFSTGSVEVAGVVYILSSEGVYACTLNGAQLIPHHQETYFADRHGIFSDPSKIITSLYLQDFKAIIFTWPEVYDSGLQSLVFYISGAYSKLNRLLPTAYPYALALNDKNTDFLWGKSLGKLYKSEYPSVDLVTYQPSYIQTPHTDCGTARSKVWSEFVIEFDNVTYGVTIQAFIDFSTVPIEIAADEVCVKGDNTFWLDDLPCSKTLSILISINNHTTAFIVSDDDPETFISDEDGNLMVTSINPGNWVIKELRLRFRAKGPDL